jgi:hypothetical protein
LTVDPATAGPEAGANFPSTAAFTFGTPAQAPSLDGGAPNYCGRIVFSDIHAGADEAAGATDTNPPPSGCNATAALTPDQDAIEFMLFDTLVGAACVTVK